MVRTSSTSDYHASSDACIVARMQKAASAVDADTSFRAAARTSPAAVSGTARNSGIWLPTEAFRPAAVLFLLR
jgi:hypothetical protein